MMKSNQIIAQNQRVQRITPTIVVVGIDIGEEKHVAQATDFRGIVITNRAWTFANTAQGFESLLDQIQRVQGDQGLDRVVWDKRTRKPHNERSSSTAAQRNARNVAFPFTITPAKTDSV